MKAFSGAVAAVAAILGMVLGASSASASCAAVIPSAPLFAPMPGELAQILVDDACRNIYATNELRNTVEVYSLESRTLTGSIAVGARPRGMDTSPDGRTLYVVNTEENTISVIDLARRVETRKVAVPSPGYFESLQYVAVLSDGTVMTVTGGRRLVQMNPVTFAVTERKDFPFTSTVSEVFMRASSDRSVIGFISTARDGTGTSFTRAFKYELNGNRFTSHVTIKPSRSADIAFSPSGSVGFVNNGYILNERLETVRTSDPCCLPYGIAINPAGTIGYQVTGGIEVTDLNTGARLGTLALGDTVTSDSFSYNGVGRLAISRDGALLAAITDSGISVVRAVTPAPRPAAQVPASGTCSTTFVSPMPVQVSGLLGDVLIDDKCEYLYATNAENNQVEVYSLLAHKFLTPIAVGAQPAGLDTSPDGKTLYVANSGAGNISIVDLVRGRETQRVNIPGGVAARPHTIASAQNGMVLLTTSTYLMRMDPYSSPPYAVGQIFLETGRLKASADRSVIGITDDLGSLLKYESAGDRFPIQFTIEFGHPPHFVAFDHTGKTVLINEGPQVLSAGVLDAGFNQRGKIESAYGGRGVALDPLGGIGYQVTSNGSIQTMDMATLKVMGYTNVGANIGGADAFARLGLPNSGLGNLAISRDGTVLATVTGSGFALVRVKDAVGGPPAPAIPERHLVAFSTKQAEHQSFLRFFNDGPLPGTVSVTLSDFATGAHVAQWTSAAIASGAAPHFGIATMEAAATQPFTKPDYYLLKIKPSINGSVTHTVWHASGAMSDLSACDSVMPTARNTLVGVHSSLMDPEYSGSVAVVNTGTQASPYRLQIHDAATGKHLGVYISTPVSPGAGQVLRVDTIERGAGIAPASVSHYLMRLFPDGPFEGFAQHIIHNRQVGALTDTTPACALPSTP